MRYRVLLATTLAAALSSGCGWLGASRPVASDDGRSRLSRAGLVAAAEDACTTRARAIEALPRPRTKRERRQFFARVAAIELNEYAALASLRPPSRDEAEFARLLAASRDVAELARRFHRAVVKPDAAERRRAVAQADHASARYDRAARALRLACRQTA